MTLQDWDDYGESSALGDEVTTHMLCVKAEDDRTFYGKENDVRDNPSGIIVSSFSSGRFIYDGTVTP